MSTGKHMYATLGRLAYKTVYPLLKLYTTDKHRRVRVLVLNGRGEVLLVRSWLGDQHWSMPGGGVRRSETSAQAAQREVKEETGLLLSPQGLRKLGSFVHPDPAYAFTVDCFVVTVAKEEPRIARRHRMEVLDSAWFQLGNLPRRYSRAIDSALALNRG